jgi:YVTN family beta-propeller protein
VISRRTLLAGLPLLAACDRQPGAGYRGFAFVSTDDAASLVAVDLMAFAVKGRIPLPAPAPLVVRHPNEKTPLLYALSPGSRSAEEIDYRTRKRLRSIKLGGEPVAVRECQGQLWCLLRGTQPQVAPLEGRGIALPAQPVDFDVSARSPMACATLANGSVVFLDLKARRAFPPVPLGEGLGQVRFRSDGKLVLAADRTRRQLTVLDVAAQAVVTQLPLSLSPDHLCYDNGGQLFVTGEGRDAVVIAYPYSTEIAQTALSGRKPGTMAVSTSPPYLFVANPQAGSVSVFDIATQKVVAVIGAGMEPGNIAVTPDQQYALVLNRASGDMAVIRIPAITGGRNKSAPLFTMIPVGTRPGAILITPSD